MTSTSFCDDPDKLLNEWLGELDNLIGVSLAYIHNTIRYKKLASYSIILKYFKIV